MEQMKKELSLEELETADVELLSELFCDKCYQEFDKYENWLLQQSPDEMLKYAQDYTKRSMMLEVLYETELNREQLIALLQVEYPLAKLCHLWFDTYKQDYRDSFETMIGAFANYRILHEKEFRNETICD